MERITSRQNPLMTHIRKLASSAAYRRERGEYLGDGVKLLEEAIRWGSELTCVVTAEGVDIPVPAGVRQVEVPSTLMDAISPADTPQGALFIAARPDPILPGTLAGERYLVLDGVQDPGNVGTIWRTADGLGADGLLLLPGCADPWSPKTVRAAMGAAFRLPVWQTTGEELKRLLKSSRLPLWGTALRADSEDIRQMGKKRCAVVIGSEGKGISPDILTLCDRTFHIPMRPRCESLNAAVAASVVLWEMAR